MQILYAPPAAAGVSEMVAVSGDDTYVYPLSGLLPDGASTLDYLLWAALGAGVGYYVLGQKQPKRLAMYAVGGVAARLFL
jgi:uncharacterized protein HemX